MIHRQFPQHLASQERINDYPLVKATRYYAGFGEFAFNTGRRFTLVQFKRYAQRKFVLVVERDAVDHVVATRADPLLMHWQVKQSRYHYLTSAETFVESHNISLLFIQVDFIVCATDRIDSIRVG